LAATGFDFAFAEGPARGLAYVFVDATAITVSASASTEARAVVFVAVFFSVLLDLEVPRLLLRRRSHWSCRHSPQASSLHGRAKPPAAHSMPLPCTSDLF